MPWTGIKTPIFALLLALLPVSPVSAAESTDKNILQERESLLEGDLEGGSDLVIHGFLSQGFIESTTNNYIPNSQDGSFDFNEAGLNLNKQVSNNLRAGVQLFARDLGRTGVYDAKFDWFLLDYHWRDWLGIRAGRIKLPFGLYNDISDIDSARNSILLPQSLYPISNRDFLLAQSGAEIYGFIDLNSAGSLEYSLYRGTIKIEAAATPGATTQVQDVDVPYVHGGRLTWDTPVKGLRVGSTYQNVLINTDTWVPSLSKSLQIILQVSMAIASVEYTTPDYQLAAEYSRWWGVFGSNKSTILPTAYAMNERAYVMASLRLKEWLHPGFYYSTTYSDNNQRDLDGSFVKDSAVFVRVDLTPHWLFKLEAHAMNGTYELDPSINNGKQPANMSQYWDLFLAKTTILF